MENPTEPPRSPAGSLCLTLFALPFAAAGVAMAGVVGGNLLIWRAAQQWVETPATLLHAELQLEVDGDGVVSLARASYRYSFNGNNYKSDRVAVRTGSDNVGRYQQDRAKELNRIMQTGGHTSCFVDPAHPTTALLFRDLRPGLTALEATLALALLGVGLGMLIGGIVDLCLAIRRETGAAPIVCANRSAECVNREIAIANSI